MLLCQTRRVFVLGETTKREHGGNRIQDIKEHWITSKKKKENNSRKRENRRKDKERGKHRASSGTGVTHRYMESSMLAYGDMM